MITAEELRSNPVYRASRVGALRQDALLTTLITELPEKRVRILIGVDGSAPPWLTPILRRLRQIAALAPGWDSYDAEPPSATVIARAVDLVGEAFLEFDGLHPNVVATPAGNVQIEFEDSRDSLEFHVSRDGIRVVYQDLRQGIEWESPLNERKAEIRDILTRLSH
jgi:hypothetical protein